MKTVYPVILTETKTREIPYLVYVPDMDTQTQGEDLADAIYMAEDAISLRGVTLEDDGRKIPSPSDAASIDVTASPWHNELESEDGIVSETITLIPVDFDLYRKKLKSLSVRRNVSLPAWLDYEAQRAGFNVSAILQEALREKLGVEAQ